MPNTNLSTAAWNYAIGMSAKGPIGASAVITMAPTAPRPPLPAYPQPVTSYAIPKASYVPSTSPTGARASEFYGLNSAGKPLAPVTGGPTYAAPGVRGPAPFHNVQPHPSAYKPAPVSTANNPAIPGLIPAQPGTGNGATGLPRYPVRGAPRPEMSIPKPRGGISTGAGVGLGITAVASAAAMMATGVPVPQAIGAATGGAVGAGLGGYAGAAIGSLAGPIGTAVGYWAGSAVGGIVGGAIGQQIANMVSPPKPDQAIAQGGSPGTLPPFEGGQSDNVPYFVNWSGQKPFGEGPINGQLGVYGPVQSIGFTQTSSTYYGGSYTVQVIARPAPDELPRLIEAGPFLFGTGGYPYFTNIVRQDGLPEESGGSPGTGGEPSIPRPAEVLPANPPTTDEPQSATPAPAPTAPPLTSPGAPAKLAPPGEVVPDLSPNEPGEGEDDPENAPQILPKKPAGVGPLAAATAVGLVGIGLSSGLRPVPKGGQSIVDAPTNEISKPPTPPPQYPKTTNPCGCNKPVLNGLDDLSKKVDLVNAGLEGASLAALLAELTKIGNAVGVSAFPASVPANLAKPGAGSKALGSLAEMHVWQVEQLDGLVGAFPQTTNVVLPNGSTVEMQQPNIAESLAEIQGMLFGQAITTGEVLHTASRTLHQAGSATQQAHLAHLYSRGNAEFLGYEGAAASVDIPMAYSPGKEPFEGLLGESIQKIRGWENRDGQDLKAILAELLQAAHIIQAVHWKKLDASGNFKDQIQNDLRAQSAYLDGEADRKKGASDWEAYLQQVEQGFAARSGDSTPYGRPPTEAPRIRDLSDPDADGQGG